MFIPGETYSPSLDLRCPKCGKLPTFTVPTYLQGGSGNAASPSPTNAAIPTKADMHKEICLDLNELYRKKNADYGDSFGKTFAEEGFAMVRIRLMDKFERFKTLSKGNQQQVNDESIEDTLLDLANYAMMTVVEMRRKNHGSSN